MALRLPTEEHRDVLVPQQFQAEPVRERRGEIPATAGLASLRKELQNLPDISDLKVAHPLVCIRPEWQAGEMVRCSARESCPQPRGVKTWQPVIRLRAQRQVWQHETVPEPIRLGQRLVSPRSALLSQLDERQPAL
jgi:hypothetical protein